MTTTLQPTSIPFGVWRCQQLHPCHAPRPVWLWVRIGVDRTLNDRELIGGRGDVAGRASS